MVNYMPVLLGATNNDDHHHLHHQHKLQTPLSSFSFVVYRALAEIQLNSPHDGLNVIT
ncbi:hypothetical protein QTP88_024496 [Uroleucon formosanum]